MVPRIEVGHSYPEDRPRSWHIWPDTDKDGVPDTIVETDVSEEYTRLG